MGKNIIRWLVVVVILGLLAVTNPTTEDFVDWKKEQVMRSEPNVLGWAGAQVGGLVMSQATERTNLGFAGVFRVELPGEKEPAWYLGVLGQFVPLVD